MENGWGGGTFGEPRWEYEAVSKVGFGAGGIMGAWPDAGAMRQAWTGAAAAWWAAAFSWPFPRRELGLLCIREWLQNVSFRLSKRYLDDVPSEFI